MNLNLGLSSDSVDTSTHLLSPILSDELSLFFKTRRAHWYFNGPEKAEWTLFFESQYKQIEDVLENIIGYIRPHHDNTAFCLNDFLESSHAAGAVPFVIINLDPVSELLAEHKKVILKLREMLSLSADEQYNVAMTDFFLDLIGLHENMTCMLKIRKSNH